MRFIASAPVAQRINTRLPAGRTVRDLRLVQARATVQPLAEVPEADRARIAAAADAARDALATAGGPPLITDGEPTKMLVTAWMCHEGRNNNGLFFVREELPDAAAKIKAPNVLPMDWNHSAVLGWSFDQKAIGVWFSAEYAFDPRARDGAGAWGLLAQGVMWAWAFPEYADTMLAEQERHGHLEFSMACLPTSTELVTDASGRYEIAHHPVFFTLSALDVPPADPDARGRGQEGSYDADTHATQRRDLLSAADAPASGAVAADPAHPQEDAPMADQNPLEARVAELSSQLETLTTQLTDNGAAVATATGRATAAEAQVAELTAQLAEARTAADALRTELEAAQASAATLQTTLETAQARVAEFEARDAEAAADRRLATRIAELPEAYRAAHAKRPEADRQVVETRWRNANDEQWAAIKGDLAVVSGLRPVDYLRLSRDEGDTALPAGTATAGLSALMDKVLS